MTVISINPPKALAELGITERFEFDTDKVNAGAYEYMLKQGLRYALSARASHAFAALREDGSGPIEQHAAQAVIDRLREDCYAPTWPERERSERSVLSLEEQVWNDLLKAAFTKAEALRKGRAARPANGDKPAQPAVPAITVDTLVAEHGGREAAYTGIFDNYVRRLYAQKGTAVDDALAANIQARAEKGWADLQAAHAKELKARQRAAAKQADPDVVSL